MNENLHLFIEKYAELIWWEKEGSCFYIKKKKSCLAFVRNTENGFR